MRVAALAALSLGLLGWWIAPSLVPFPAKSLRATSDDLASTVGAFADPVLLHSSDTTGLGLLASPHELHALMHPVIVVSTSGVAPSRRAGEQPFLSVAGPDTPLSASAFNAAIAELESALGRRLFPLTLQAVDFKAHLSPEQLAQGRRPYVIYDASAGLVLVDADLLRSSFSQEHVTRMAELLASSTCSSLASLVSLAQQAGSTLSGHLAVTLLAQAAAVAVPAAFAAAPPLWFCILCPAILGLAAPLIINFGLGELAAVLCSRLALDDTQCFDLMLGALGLGFVLSLASAIPIFFVCRLMECAHRNTTSFLRIGSLF